MAQGLRHYPTTPDRPPLRAVTPPALYWVHLALAFLGIVAFFAIYLALIALFGWLTWDSVFQLPPVGGWFGLTIYAGRIAGCAMLTLFFLKGLFKYHRASPDDSIQITEQEQPEFFAFLRRLAREMGVRLPDRVSLFHEVNAEAAYDRSLLNLIVPVRRRIGIGLGLIEVLTISEFKFALAHELAHLTQGGMVLALHVQGMYSVIDDLVTEEDWWDDLLDGWCEMEHLFALAGMLLRWVVRAIRTVLQVVLVIALLGERALSRQMEYHADRLAAAAAGTDAALHVLYRYVHMAPLQAEVERALVNLAHQGVFTSDMMSHLRARLEAERLDRSDPEFGTPPRKPDPAAQQYFLPIELPMLTQLMDSHPTEFQRERNLRRHPIEAPLVDVPAWELFRDRENLTEALTVRMYAEHLGSVENQVLKPPAEVEVRLRALLGQSGRLDPRYGGIFDGRFLGVPDPEGMAQALLRRPLPPDRLRATIQTLYAGVPHETARKRRTLERELRFLSALESGELKWKGRTLEFRGEQRPVTQVTALRRQVERERDETLQELYRLDGDIFRAHYQIAATIAQPLATQLIEHYRFQANCRGIAEEAATVLNSMSLSTIEALERGSGKRNATEFRIAADRVRTQWALLQRCQERLRSVTLPASARDAGRATLSAVVETTGLPSPPSNEDLAQSPKPLFQLLQVTGEITTGVERARFQGLPELLKLQEQIASAYRNPPPQRPTQAASEAPSPVRERT